MNLSKILAELRNEREQIEEAAFSRAKIRLGIQPLPLALCRREVLTFPPRGELSEIPVFLLPGLLLASRMTGGLSQSYPTLISPGRCMHQEGTQPR